MDIEIVGEVLTNFKPYVVIIDEIGEILWGSQKLMDLLNVDIRHGINIKSIFGDRKSVV